MRTAVLPSFDSRGEGENNSLFVITWLFSVSTFTKTGSRARDRWLVDGSPDFSVLPAGAVPRIDVDVPIWLYVGTAAYGETHIRGRHWRWVEQTRMEIPQLVYQKLGQPGQIWCTEEQRKLKINLRLNPASLLVMTLFDGGTPHFSVTTLYPHQSKLDGEHIGRYGGRVRASKPATPGTTSKLVVA